MTITKTFALALVLALPIGAAADDKTAKTPTTDKDTKKTAKPAKLVEADVKIVAHVHHVNVMEVDMGKLAQKLGTAPVQRYGEALVRDHSTADKELATFAKPRGLAVLPMPKPATDAEKAEMKTMMDKMAGLKKLKGAEFDRAYVRMMVEGHDKELAMSDPNIAVATDPELKTLLENRKTTLQRHADAAKQLEKGNAQASTGSSPRPPSK